MYRDKLMRVNWEAVKAMTFLRRAGTSLAFGSRESNDLRTRHVCAPWTAQQSLIRLLSRRSTGWRASAKAWLGPSAWSIMPTRATWTPGCLGHDQPPFSSKQTNQSRQRLMNCRISHERGPAVSCGRIVVGTRISSSFVLGNFGGSARHDTSAYVTDLLTRPRTPC